MGTCSRQAGNWCDDAKCLAGCKLLTAGPIPMLLFCPNCAKQHVDEPNPAVGWDNPPHRTHQCAHCGHLWRPADVATVGVRALNTKGQGDMDPAPNMIRALADALHRRDKVWIRALLVALPFKNLPMLLSVFARCAPEMQETSDAHRQAFERRLREDMHATISELAAEPRYFLPQTPDDLVK